MNVGGFTLGKKQFIIIGVIVGLIGILAFSSMAKENKLKQQAYEQAQKDEEARLEQQQAQANNNNNPVELDRESLLQQDLVEEFGEAPEGFKWDARGELVPLGSDNMTASDVIFTYVRSLSLLDFSTAQRYASASLVSDTYKGYYDVASQYRTDYYNNFLRKQYKKCLTSVELNDVQDTAIFADGAQIVTLCISSLDLTDKDFWLKDKQKIYDTMELYNETESDSVKMETYIYDYIYACYLDGTIKKKDYNIEIVVSKDKSGGWLVSNDSELNSVLSYESGVDVATHIINSYNEWYMDKVREEATSNYVEY